MCVLGGQRQSKQEPALEGSWQAWAELPGSSTTHWAREGPSFQEGMGKLVAPRSGHLGSIARHTFHTALCSQIASRPSATLLVLLSCEASPKERTRALTT